MVHTANNTTVFLGLPQKKQKSFKKYQTCKENHWQIQQIWSYSNTELSCPLSIVIISLAHAHTHTRTRPASLLKQEGWVQPVKCVPLHTALALPLVFTARTRRQYHSFQYTTSLDILHVFLSSNQQKNRANGQITDWLCGIYVLTVVNCVCFVWCCDGVVFDFGMGNSFLLMWLKFVKTVWWMWILMIRGGMSLGLARFW